MYLTSGMSFERGPGSGVTIRVPLPALPGYEAQTLVEELSAEQWATLVSSVSLPGENGETHRAALSLHGDGLL